MLLTNLKIVVGFQALVQSRFTKVLYILCSSPALKFLALTIKNTPVLKEVSFLTSFIKTISLQPFFISVFYRLDFFLPKKRWCMF